MNKILARDINDFVGTFSLGEELHGSTFLITGATGLIGSTLIRCLSALKENIHIFAPIRNMEKSQQMFGNNYPNVDFIECDILTYDYGQLGNVDYIVHCAAPTASRFFVEHAVETINTIYSGTMSLLDYAMQHSVKSIVYLSSLEVYGTIHDDSNPVTEDMQGYLDPLSIRSSYPMAKRTAENLCVAYAKEYGVPTKIARLTQIFGAGISKDDNRVFAQFARAALNGSDIILKSSGKSSKPYCYTTDAISAILTILLKGMNGKAYNVSNDSTYISINDMAQLVKENFNPQVNVIHDIDSVSAYAPETLLKLSSAKLRALGWNPYYNLIEMYQRLIAYLT